MAKQEDIRVIKGTEHPEEFNLLARKQEEIKKAIDTYTDDGCLYLDKDCELRQGGYCVSGEESYKCLMKRLDELGVVIKVDRELPDEVLIGVLKSLYNRLDADKDLAEIKAIGYVLDMLKTDVVVVPLIKEG